MKLTGKLLTKIEQSMRIILTPEQRLILLYWYKCEPRGECWDEEDFFYGIRRVRKYYPDHREKPSPLPDFLIKDTLDGEPF